MSSRGRSWFQRTRTLHELSNIAMGIFKPATHETGASDPILTRIAEEDKTPWYRKRNLRYLYFMLFPTCMGIELTSGFDSQMINALQIVPSWIECTLRANHLCFPHSITF